MMYEEGNILELLAKYAEMVKANALYFFDVEEFEHIVDHFFMQHELDKAMAAIAIAEAQHPNSSTFGIKRAQYFLLKEQLDLATVELDKVAAVDPNNDELLRIRASILSKQGRHNQALKMLKAALQHAEDPIDIHSLMAIEYQFLGNYSEAIKWLKLVLDEIPEDEVAMYNITSCYDALNDPLALIEYLNAFIEANPYNELAWYHLGVTHAKRKQYPEAIRCFDYALLADEYFTAAYYELARVYEILEQYKEAAGVYLRSMEFEDASGFIYFKLGHCYMSMQNFKQASRYYKRAIKEDPELDEAYIELAALQAADGDINSAAYNLNKGLSLDPENPDYLYTAVEIFYQIDYLLDAIKTYQKIMELGFDDDEMFMDYAELLVEMDEVDDALTVLLEGILKYPDCEDMHLMLAGYMLAVGDSIGAMNHLLEANSLDQDAMTRFTEFFPELLDDKKVRVLLDGFKS